MELSKIRKPCVAGQFYPLSKSSLKIEIDALVDKKAEKKNVIACILPHAGYMYSGKVAAETVSQVNIKDTVILLGPNHTGNGAEFSIMTEGTWQTPLGEIKIDSDLAASLLKNSKNLEDDLLAHLNEHSLEVELPLLQYFRPDFKIVPIAFSSDNIKKLKETGASIAQVLKNNSQVLMVASTDMTHYESQESAKKKDNEAINAILELDEDSLIEKIQRFNITMCGFAPVIVLIVAAKLLGAKHATLVKYQTSGDITGDKESVVGYAGIILY
jgi:MEMO1 family protein